MVTWITPSGTLDGTSNGEISPEGSTFSFNILATDPSSILNYVIIDGSLPNGITLNQSSGLISGLVPHADAATTFVFVVRATAVNNLSFADQQFDIRIENIGDLPVWNPEYLSYQYNNLNVLANTGPLTEGSMVNIVLAASDIVVPSETITFSLLNGSLPIGLSLSNNGILSGQIFNLPRGTQVFQFTIRIANLLAYSDRSFTLSATGTEQAPIWVNLTNNLGAYEQGTFIELQLDAISPNGSPITYSLVGGILPNGLFVNSSGLFYGALSEAAIPATYSFTIAANDGILSTNQTFQLTVDPFNPASLSSSANTIIWNTPSGDIGDIIATYPSYLGVSASSLNGSNVTYSLSPVSGPLPFGLSIDSDSGEIRGISPYVNIDTVYNFIVRASNGIVVSDRTFSLTIIAEFTSANLSTVYVTVTGPDRLKLFYKEPLDQYLTNDILFRPLDPNFGRSPAAKITISDGLNLVDDQTFWNSITRGSTNLYEWFQKTRWYIGYYEWAVARDKFNNVAYEVIYRRIVDPLAGSGGFDSSGNPVMISVNPNSQNITQIYPPSIDNMRDDLAYTIGYAGTEKLPLWQLSQQTTGDSTSVLGYMPCLVVAYVQPGQASGLIDQLIASSQNTFELGHPILVDRVLYQTLISTATTFDVSTVFDFNLTTFDKLSQVSAKYFKFPPSNPL